MRLVSLSMRPSLLYPDIVSSNPTKTMFANSLIQGEVVGKEDYGYTINLGFAETKGFYQCDPSAIQRAPCIEAMNRSVHRHAAIVPDHQDREPRGVSGGLQGQGIGQVHREWLARRGF